MKSTDAISALAALAQEHRLAIFRVLVRAGPTGKSAGDIARQVGIAPATLSFHLKTLSQAGLAVSRREGRTIFYAASYDVMSALLRYLTEECCGGACGAFTLEEATG
ncbi:MAG: metalloregulator ArsR/SmtB family transcription factor [Gammaproteobacteria bacterium]